MKLIVDANILFSFFKKDSFTRRFILSHPELELFTSEYVFDELEEHKEKVKSKAKIDNRVFESSKKELLAYVTVVSLGKFEKFWKQAGHISPDPDDTEYFAIALSLKLAIWSNDKLLKQQSKVRIFSTKELLELIG